MENNKLLQMHNEESKTTNPVEKAYNDILELCAKTMREIEYLNFGVELEDEEQLECLKTKALIRVIELEVKLKKQSIYDGNIQNHRLLCEGLLEKLQALEVANVVKEKPLVKDVAHPKAEVAVVASPVVNEPPKLVFKADIKPPVFSVPAAFVQPVIVASDEVAEVETLEVVEEDAVNRGSRLKSFIKIILNVSFYSILTISILFIVFFGMFNHSGQGRPRGFMGISVMRVVSGSMEPTLPIDTVIVVREVEIEQLVAGDIVTFINEQQMLVTHRIYDIYEGHFAGERGFRLIGDANLSVDQEVYPAFAFVGVYIYSNYNIGRFLMFIHAHFIFALLMTSLILIALFFFKMRLRIKKELN